MSVQDDLPIHPLLLDVVIRKVFTYCDYNELDICRLVCSKWQSAAQRLWVKKSPVVGVNKRYSETCSRKVFLWKGKNKTSRWPSWNYDKFCVAAFSLSSRRSWEIFFKLMITHGELLTMLEIVDFRIPNENILKDIFSCKCTPQLQTLKLTRVDFSFVDRSTNNKDDYLQLLDDNYSSRGVSSNVVVRSMRRLEIRYDNRFQNLPLNWRNVLETFIHLESLVLDNYSPNSRSDITRVIRGIRTFQIIHDTTHPLKSLDVTKRSHMLWLGFPEEVLHALRKQKHCTGEKINQRMTFQIHTFAYSMYSEEEDDSFELLTLLQNELHRLQITFLDDHFPRLRSKVDLPEMAHLTRLDLRNVQITKFYFLLECNNLRYLNVIARLRKSHPGDHLTPTIINRPGWKFDRYGDLMPMPRMTSFHCTVELGWKEDDIQRLHNCMPNLTSLMISATTSSFSGICKYFKTLKRLFLYNSQVDDMTFTGMVESANRLVISRLLPNITDLKDLQILGVRSLCDCALCSAVELPTTLSKFAVKHGLSKTSISVLYISLGMTMDGFRALEEHRYAGSVVSRGFYSPEKFIALAITPF